MTPPKRIHLTEAARSAEAWRLRTDEHLSPKAIAEQLGYPSQAAARRAVESGSRLAALSGATPDLSDDDRAALALRAYLKDSRQGWRSLAEQCGYTGDNAALQVLCAVHRASAELIPEDRVRSIPAGKWRNTAKRQNAALAAALAAGEVPESTAAPGAKRRGRGTAPTSGPVT